MPIPSFDMLEQTENRLSNKQLFFVGGSLKSGTTWLERLLDAHPQVVCKGEAHFGSDVVFALSSFIDQYNGNTELKGAAPVHLAKYGGNTEILSYDSEDLRVLSVVAITRMFEKWLGESEVLCVGDKTPNNVRYFHTLSEYFPEAKFIHLIRDGRDVAVSLWFFNLKTDIGKTLEVWGTFESFARNFAEVWTANVTVGRAVGKRLGTGRYIELRYEDLLTETQTELTRALRFLSSGVDVKGQVLERCCELASFRRLSGGREAGSEDPESFFRKGVSGDWKEHFDEKTTAAFHQKAGRLLSELGYEVN